jgi:NAD-dependent DNA ligase
MTLDPEIHVPVSFNASRIRDRTVHEMLGVVKGMECDGVVSEEECAALSRWMIANSDASSAWPGDILATRLYKIFEDGVVTADERHELYELLCDTIGDGGHSESLAVNYSTRLPFDDPPPAIVFPGNTFVLTGKFIFGLRASCEAEILARGGRCAPAVLKQPHILVIGTLASRSWIQSDFGRKIERAVEWREQGIGIKIVSEESWTRALQA